MLNRIVIMGRLTRDPELRRTGSGIAVASFTLACDRDVKNQDGEKGCDFIECVAWRQTGELVSKYFTKGRMTVVSGRLQIRNWNDKDGNKRRTAEIVADKVYFCDSKRDGTDNNVGSTVPSHYDPQNADNSSDGGYYAPQTSGGFGVPEEFEDLDDNDAKLPF